MSLAETIYHHSLRLPERAAQEALDFIELLEQRYRVTPTLPEALPDQEKLITEASIKADDSLINGAGQEVSPLYQALMKIGFIGCMCDDEKLSANYKDQIDFSKKYSEKP